MVGHSKKYALNKEDFEKLVKACEFVDKTKEKKFIVYMLGRLGMRVGEVVHMKTHWIDFDQKVIHIPKHEPCNCKYCIRLAKRRSQRNGTLLSEELKKYWRPKKDASVRSIPFGFDSEIEEILNVIMTRYGGCPYSIRQIDYHLWRLSKIAKIDGKFRENHKQLRPHHLRATAATKFAYDGVNPMTFKTIMGWKDIETAISYLAKSGAMAKKEFDKIYGPSERHLDDNPRRVFGLNNLKKKVDILSREENIWLKRWLKS